MKPNTLTRGKYKDKIYVKNIRKIHVRYGSGFRIRMRTKMSRIPNAGEYIMIYFESPLGSGSSFSGHSDFYVLRLKQAIIKLFKEYVRYGM